METGTGWAGTPFFQQAPLAGVIFSVCLPRSGAAPLWAGLNRGLLAGLLARAGTPLSWAVQVLGPPGPRKRTTFGVEGIEGGGIWGRAGGQGSIPFCLELAVLQAP